LALRNRKLYILERPQKRSRGNQLIPRRLTRTNRTGIGQAPDRQTAKVGGVWS